MKLSTTGTGRIHTRDALKPACCDCGPEQDEQKFEVIKAACSGQEGREVWGTWTAGNRPCPQGGPRQSTSSLSFPPSSNLSQASHPIPNAEPWLWQYRGPVSRAEGGREGKRCPGPTRLRNLGQAVVMHLNSVPQATDPEGHALFSGVIKQLQQSQEKQNNKARVAMSQHSSRLLSKHLGMG